MTLRLAVWSGPRNLSTAMMYSFAARGDCAISDEPFYAPYLAQTGLDHPMRDQILQAHETDADRVAAALAQDRDEPLWYQKHMTHHMVARIPSGWMSAVRHVFLIRHPARVIASYARKRERPTVADLGFLQQKTLFEAVTDQAPLVIDATDLRRDPRAMLETMCEKLGISFTEKMLTWAPGGRPEDGVWASHWYDAVHRSTGFAGPDGPLPPVDPLYREVYEAVLPAFEALSAVRLQPR